MRGEKPKFIVLEIERVQTIRRRCRTHSDFCEICRSEAHFIELGETAKLFEVRGADLVGFIRKNGGHYTNNARSEIFICVNSFFACLDKSKIKSDVKLLGGNA